MGAGGAINRKKIGKKRKEKERKKGERKGKKERGEFNLEDPCRLYIVIESGAFVVIIASFVANER